MEGAGEERGGKRARSGGARWASDGAPGGYFAAYSAPGIHADMLADRVRLEAYFAALNAGTVEGKVVLDVGTGTGVLACMAAKAGAAKVVAVDGSAAAAAAAEAMVADNGLGHIVTVVCSPVEELELEEASVDVIVSEWMGYALIYESMLPSVVFARDAFLKPGGLVLPSRALLYAVPFTSHTGMVEELDSASATAAVPELALLDAWDAQQRFGLRWRALRPFFASGSGGLPDAATAARLTVDELEPELVAAEPGLVLDLDLSTVAATELVAGAATLSDLVFSTRATMGTPLAGICLYFDTVFEAADVVLTTSPLSPPTHWAQTLLHLPASAPRQLDLDSHVSGRISLLPDFAPGQERNLAIHLELDEHGEPGPRYAFLLDAVEVRAARAP